MLYGAYFEHYKTGLPSGKHRLPETRQLFQYTNKKFGNGFLINLDKYIAKHGVAETIKLWGAQGDKFPELINSTTREHPGV